MSKPRSKHSPLKEENGLTPQQLLFVHEYLVDLNATEAAKRALYSEKTAGQIGYQLLQKSSIQAALKPLLKAALARVDNTAERAELELHHMAYYDPADYVHITCAAEIKQLPPPVRRAITDWGYDSDGIFFLKFGKLKAVELLGKRHKLFKDVIEHHDKGGLADKLARARARKGKKK